MKWMKHATGMFLSALGGWFDEWRLRQEKPKTPVVTVVEPSGAENAGDSGERAEELSAEEVETAQREKYASILARNPDVVGWLTVENTPVDLPVLQTPDCRLWIMNAM